MDLHSYDIETAIRQRFTVGLFFYLQTHNIVKVKRR